MDHITQTKLQSKRQVLVCSVWGVCAGYKPVAPEDPGVLLSLGVPPWLRKEQLSEVVLRSNEFGLPGVKL